MSSAKQDEVNDTSEKNVDVQQQPQPAKSKGLFRKRKDENTTVVAVDEKKPSDDDKKPVNDIPPVGITEMFRCVQLQRHSRYSSHWATHHQIFS